MTLGPIDCARACVGPWVITTPNAAEQFSYFEWLRDTIVGPALVAVLFAGLTTFLIERYMARLGASQQLFDQIRVDLNQLQSIIMDYWSRPFDETRDGQIEAQVIVLDREIRSSFEILFQTGSRRVPTDNQSKVFDALDNLSLGTMGGHFQTRDRERDENQLRIALAAISELRMRLVSLKLQ